MTRIWLISISQIRITRYWLIYPPDGVKQVNNITSVYEICSKTVEVLFVGGVIPQTALI